ncbi:uncharacterized protein LOC116297645 [Actinia tenebrosa]|uniref:Uncharacterized protein LOC116297645 n=1 Tax=Actinia tenebrosa TaxID=6105 RepID=A0A6P8IAN2_ACTTE|nr:uncharacterized protein LOC116297645 [Actinia tenebrosa]
MTSHSIQDCISCLKSQTSANQVPKVFNVLQDFEESGLDPLLGTFSNILGRDTIPHVLSFLRTFRVLDVSDCELITNRNVHKTTQEEIMALVDRLNTKGPHAYWFFVHAMESLNQDFFDQMHGKIICCVCEDVAQNYNLVSQKEIVKECLSTEPSVQISKQREMINDLLGRVEQLKVSFSYLENSITDIMDKMKPFPGMVGNISQRVRNEIKDVIQHPGADEEVGSHTNVGVIKRLKVKCSQFRRQIECRLHSHSRQVQVDMDDIKSDALQDIVCKEPKPIDDDNKRESKELLPCRTYEDVWIEFEDRCFETLSQCNPFVAIQNSLGNVLLFGQKHKAKVCCAVGLAICMKIAASYLLEYSEWTGGPRPMVT